MIFSLELWKFDRFCCNLNFTAENPSFQFQFKLEKLKTEARKQFFIAVQFQVAAKIKRIF